MTLTTRLTLFFLGGLALVLAGFSTTIYVLAQRYLQYQAEERVQAVLATLVTAADLEPSGLEWDPHESHLALDQDLGEGPMPWLVVDGNENWVDGSKHFFPDKKLADSPLTQQANQVVEWHNKSWLVSERRLDAKDVAPPSTTQGERKVFHRTLIIKAGVSLEPAHATLRTLGITVGGVSTAIWLIALVGGRWYCRRALSPVTAMAAAARSMQVSDFATRLPTPDTRDEVAELGQAFNDLLARLHESFERQRRFTGDASHQLRTPLTAILGQIEVALRRERGVEELQRVLTSVDGQAQHLKQIVEMLLFLARAEAEARLPDLHEIDIAAWLTTHVQSWSAHERFSDVSVRVEPTVPVTIATHAAFLGQLIDNLVDNACKYSTRGSPIQLRLGVEDKAVILAVADSGIGIGADDLPHVFEPFYRSHAARQNGLSGVGLGLAVAQRIATALGGTLSVVSSPGKGSCFTLRLPRVR
jgi:two-component system OmpR family sensor kinase